MDQLAKRVPRMILAIVEFIYGPLAENPAQVGTPLIGELEGSRKAVLGAYRVVCSFTDTTVTIEPTCTGGADVEADVCTITTSSSR